MCLIRSSYATKVLKEQDQKEITRYKVVKISCSEVHSAYQPYIWQQGINKAVPFEPSKYTEALLKDDSVGPGAIHDLVITEGAIHVYVNKEDAVSEVKRLASAMHHSTYFRMVIVKVICDVDKLVSVGVTDRGIASEAYTEVFLEELPSVSNTGGI